MVSIAFLTSSRRVAFSSRREIRHHFRRAHASIPAHVRNRSLPQSEHSSHARPTARYTLDRRFTARYFIPLKRARQTCPTSLLHLSDRVPKQPHTCAPQHHDTPAFQHLLPSQLSHPLTSTLAHPRTHAPAFSLPLLYPRTRAPAHLRTRAPAHLPPVCWT